MTDAEKVFQKDRGSINPVHLVAAQMAGLTQAWCGARPQFKHRTWSAPDALEIVTCPRCRSAIRKGRPEARKSR